MGASPWSPEGFRRVDELMDAADREGVAYVSGGGFGCHLLYDRFIAVTYITEVMAAAALAVPDGALGIEMLIRPTDAPTTYIRAPDRRSGSRPPEDDHRPCEVGLAVFLRGRTSDRP